MKVVGIERHGCEEGREWAGERDRKETRKRPEKETGEKGQKRERSRRGQELAETCLIRDDYAKELVDSESMKYEKMKIYEI